MPRAQVSARNDERIKVIANDVANEIGNEVRGQREGGGAALPAAPRTVYRAPALAIDPWPLAPGPWPLARAPPPTLTAPTTTHPPRARMCVVPAHQVSAAFAAVVPPIEKESLDSIVAAKRATAITKFVMPP